MKDASMKLLSEFKQFAMRGNVIDLAVGVVIGTAFGKIVSSLVADVIMPPLGILLAGVDFSDLSANVGTGPDGEPVLLKYGLFLQAVIDFLIIAFVIFMAIKGINKLQRPPEPAAPPPPPRDEVLLEEIRDLLKQQQR
jgi:large conductance mechanosensitive channel